MTVNKKWSEADIIADTIGDRTTRDAADWFNEQLPYQFQVTHATIYNWIAGAFKPNYAFLLALTYSYEETDPRHVMGKEIMDMRARNINAHWAGGK